MAGSASLVKAQNTPPAPAAHPMTGKHTAHHGDRHGRDMRGHDMDDRHGSVIGDRRGLERLYRRSGRSKELSALCNDVLAKPQDPRVLDYVYQQLARLQAPPANVDQALATLRKGLNESLANEANMHAERDKMPASRQQRHADAPLAAPQPPATK